MYNFDEKKGIMGNYELYGIYELRLIARNKGVKRPTTKRKAILLDEIKKIDNGELKPYFPKEQGRPNKLIIMDKLRKMKCPTCHILKKYESLITELEKLVKKYKK